MPIEEEKEEFEFLDNETIDSLLTELDNILNQILSIDNKKTEAEKIYNKLIKCNIKVNDLPWSMKAWHTSPGYKNCILCNRTFTKRQEYRLVPEQNGARCRHGCDKNG